MNGELIYDVSKLNTKQKKDLIKKAIKITKDYKLQKIDPYFYTYNLCNKTIDDFVEMINDKSIAKVVKKFNNNENYLQIGIEHHCEDDKTNYKIKIKIDETSSYGFVLKNNLRLKNSEEYTSPTGLKNKGEIYDSTNNK